MDRNRRFEGKVALVTGGTTGIGLSTAEGFAREGAQVVICGRSRPSGEKAMEEIRKHGGKVAFIQADVSDEASVKEMMQKIDNEYGGLDIAYNNAGITGSTGVPIVEASVERFDQVMATNVRGVWLCMKYEFASMLRQGGGSIINCSSTAGIRGGTGDASAYYASKHAVIGMTKNVAMEGARNNIRVNAILPGMVMTDLVANNFKDNKDKLEMLYNRIPMGRSGSGDELADAVLWLASDESSFVTGISLSVDGGTVI